MSLTVGRASGLLPDQISVDGSRVSITGVISESSVDAFNARRQQITGTVDNDDENAFPVTYALDSTLDGFYRVTQAQVEPMITVHNAFGRFSVQMERISGFRSPAIEMVHTATLRANGLGIVGATTYVAWPQSGPVDVGFPANSRATETGTVWITTSSSTTSSLTYMSTAANYYNGSCRVEGLFNATWFPLVGVQPHASTAASLRLNNGALRVSISASAVLTVEVWNGSAWQAASSTFIIQVGANTISTPSEVRIIRNSPDVVTLRMTLARSFTTASAEYVAMDLTLRRGMRHVDMQLLSSNLASPLRLAPNPTVAGTSLTANGFVRQTSNDGNGNRFLLGGTGLGFTPTISTANTTYETTPASTTTYYGYMIGMELGGSTAVSPSDAASIRDEYMAAVASVQRVQVR